jgi:serine/threonine protein kinase
MNNRLSQRARIVFEQVMEMDESRQIAFVQKVCGADQPLLAEVMKMIAADRRTAPILDQPMMHWGFMARTTHKEQPDKLPFNYIGNYKLIDKLGEGGMGEVYLAIEEPVGRKVAIKLMRDGLDAGHLKRFNDERKVLANLNQRNIVTLYTSGAADGRPYFVMEYLEGESLRQRLQRGPLPQSEIVEITRQICAALGAAHSKEIVHRDIKPENIILTRDEDGLLVKILDFGVAILKESDTQTKTNALIGTAVYFSPEQAQCLDRKKIDGRADIYSLGAMVYEMLTGTTVFTATSLAGYVHQHINATPEPPSQRQPAFSISPELDRVVLRALEKIPEVRFASAREFAQSLKQAIEGTVKATVPIAVPDSVSGSVPGVATAPDGAYDTAVDGASNPIEPAPVAAVLDTRPMPRKTAAARYAWPLAALLLLSLGGGGWWALKHFNSSPVSKTGNTNTTAEAASAISRPDLKIEIEQEGIGIVSGDKIFHNRERVRLIATPDQSGYVYILMKGTDGPAEVLYPGTGIKGSYGVAQANQRIEMPPSNNEMPWFRFDNRRGVETLYVVFTAKPGDERLRALETAIQQKRSQLNADEEQQTLSELDALAAGQSASPTMTAKKIQLRHER